jgi:hypothetical protein
VAALPSWPWQDLAAGQEQPPRERPVVEQRVRERQGPGRPAA